MIKLNFEDLEHIISEKSKNKIECLDFPELSWICDKGDIFVTCEGWKRDSLQTLILTYILDGSRFDEYTIPTFGKIEIDILTGKVEQFSIKEGTSFDAETVQTNCFKGLLRFTSAVNCLLIRNIQTEREEILIEGSLINCVSVNPNLPYFCVTGHFFSFPRFRVFKIMEENFEKANNHLEKYDNDMINNLELAVNNIKSNFHYNISMDYIEFSLTELNKILGNTNELTQTIARINRLNQSIRLGICEKPDLERNQIRWALLSYLESSEVSELLANYLSMTSQKNKN